MIGSSKQEVGYYSDLGEDYYVDGGEPPGTWWGTGAEELGLSDKVGSTEFRNVLEGLSPDGKQSLVQNAKKKERRAGFDLTFSVPKSVSIARVSADPQQAGQIDQACDKAAEKAFEAVQELCGFTRRGGAGRLNETGKLVAGVFRHETARGLKDHVPDPNLHYHMVLCNVCVREDGTTGTFDGRVLFRRQMKMALGALFRTELSKQLADIGLELHRPENDRGKPVSWFELKAVPDKLIQAFSKRRNQIVNWLQANGQSGAKAAEKAALSTRESKSHFSRSELKRAWKAVSRKFGLSSDKLKENSHTIFLQDAAMEAEQAVQRGLEQLTQERGHFTETDLLRHAAQEGQCQQVGSNDVIASVRQTLANDQQIVPLQIVEGERRYTTVEMLEVEKRMFAAAERAQGNDRYVVSDRTLAKVIEAHATLRPEQREAVRHITTKLGRISCVNGMAGTGKTFMLGVAREAWEAAGFKVIGTALAAKAAQGLQEGSGIQSTHIHRLLYEIKNGRRTLNEQTVLVIDESGMVGTRMMEELVSLTERTQTKLVLVGDHKQLQAIDAGAPFRGLAERLGVAELREITRQRERWARQAVTDLATGQAESALQQFARRGLLKITEDRNTAMEQLVKDWHLDFQKGLDARILAGRRLETTAINRLCQQTLIESDHVKTESIAVGRYDFHVGDQVVVTRNNASLLVRNGTQGIVTGIDAERNEIQLCIDGGLTVRINTELFPHIDLGYCTTTHKAQGATVESAFVLIGGPMTDRQLSYVQGSRAKGTTRFYADRLNGGSDIQQLADQMARSRAKDLIHDYIIEAA